MSGEITRLRARLKRSGTGYPGDIRSREGMRRRGLLSMMGAGWATGTASSLALPSVEPFIWIIVIGPVVVIVLMIDRSLGFLRPNAFLSCAMLAASWTALQTSLVPSGHADLLRRADGRIVGVEGTLSAVDAPVRGDRLERHGRPRNSCRLRLVDLVISNASGDRFSHPGPIGVVVRGAPNEPSLDVGSTIRVRGRLKREREPSNPGCSGSRVTGMWIDVPDFQMVQGGRRPANPNPDVRDLARWWKDVARERLLESLGASGDDGSRRLVMAVVLGVRDPDFDSMSLPYRMTGLAHYLAVSGFAFGVLVSVPRVLGSSLNPVVGTILVILTVVLGLSAVDLRSPALRAGLIAMVVALGGGMNREWNRLDLLGLCCILMLACDPVEILNPGFQLSFMVVAGLIIGAPRIGYFMTTFIADRGVDPATGPVRIRVIGAASCGAAAWITAAPLVAHHFGIVSPYGLFLSVLAAPVVSIIVIGSAAAILTGLCIPVASWIPGHVAGWSAWLLDELVGLSAGIPGSCFVVPLTGSWWLLSSELVVWRWLCHRSGRERWILVPLSCLLVSAPFAIPDRAAIESGVVIDTLDVGDGTCHVIRGPEGTALIDAGSSSRSGCSTRIVIPALRHDGIGRIEKIVITHANLDHFSAVGDLLGRVPIERLIVGRSFMDAAMNEPGGPESELLETASSWSVPVLVVEAGAIMTACGLDWTFIHPDPDLRWSTENDRSLVVRIDGPGVPEDGRSLALFTGDIEEASMNHLLMCDIVPSARFLEAPHHGSIRRSSAEFIERVDPEVIIQSTGARRLRRDELGAIVGDRMRLSTARHGAIKTTLKPDGTTEVRGFDGVRFKERREPLPRSPDPESRPR